MTVLEFLKTKVEMPEPPVHDYALYSPVSIDDEASITIQVWTSPSKSIRLEWNLATSEVKRTVL